MQAATAPPANLVMLPDVPIYDELPAGWVDINDIVEAPAGFRWINNHKSIFDPDYRHALLRMTQPVKEPEPIQAPEPPKKTKQEQQLSLW